MHCAVRRIDLAPISGEFARHAKTLGSLHIIDWIDDFSRSQQGRIGAFCLGCGPLVGYEGRDVLIAINHVFAQCTSASARNPN